LEKERLSPRDLVLLFVVWIVSSLAVADIWASSPGGSTSGRGWPDSSLIGLIAVLAILPLCALLSTLTSGRRHLKQALLIFQGRGFLCLLLLIFGFGQILLLAPATRGLVTVQNLLVPIGLLIILWVFLGRSEIRRQTVILTACWLVAVALSGRTLGLMIEKFDLAAASWRTQALAMYLAGSLLLLALAPLLSVAAWVAAGDGPLMKSAWLAAGTWLLGILCVFAANWDRKSRLEFSAVSRPDLLIACLVFVAALLLRGLLIGQIPWLLTGDESSAGLSAVEFVRGVRNNLFGVGWYSFPSLYFFVQSLSIRVLGQTAQALRITSALAGALTVFALYYFARETLGRGVALIAASYLAASHFHIHFSRIGLNNVWDGLFIVGFSAFLWHAWDFGNESSVGRRFSFVMAGVVLGLAQYFYTSTRVLFPMLFAWLIVAALRERKAVFQRLPGLAAMLLAAAVTFLPLALYFNRHQEEFFAPFKRVAVLGPWLQDEISRTGLPAWRIMAEQFRISALAFTHVEIRMWYQPGTPMLLPAGAALFILGLVLLMSNLLDLRRLWLALWLLSAVTIGALSHGSPAAQRLTVAVPAVAIVLALPLAEAYRWLVHLWPARAAILRAAVGVALAVVVVWDLNFYFLRYSAERRFGDVNTETADVAASFLQDAESGHQVFFLGSPRMGYKSISALPYLLPQVEARDVLQPLSDAPLQALTMPTTFIILPERQAELPLLQERYPGGVLTEHSGKDSRLLFVAYSLGRPP